jgi:hypothetical protein
MSRKLIATLKKQRLDAQFDLQNRELNGDDSSSQGDLGDAIATQHSISGTFQSDKITPLMRAATSENPDTLIELLNDDNHIATLFVKDAQGRTALDWARLVNLEMNVIAIRKAMLNNINESRVDLVDNNLDIEMRARAANEDASQRLFEACRQKDTMAALEVIRTYKELDRELIEDLMDRDEQEYKKQKAAYLQSMGKCTSNMPPWKLQDCLSVFHSSCPYRHCKHVPHVYH